MVDCCLPSERRSVDPGMKSRLARLHVVPLRPEKELPIVLAPPRPWRKRVISPRGRPHSSRLRQCCLPAVLRGTLGRSGVGPRSEIEEVAIESGGALGPPGEARLGRDNRPERLLEQLAVTARAVRSLHILAAGHLQRLHPIAEDLAHVLLAPPQWRRQRCGWQPVVADAAGSAVTSGRTARLDS